MEFLSEQSRVEQIRGEQNGVEWSGVEWSGLDWTGMECGEWSGQEWNSWGSPPQDSITQNHYLGENGEFLTQNDWFLTLNK